MLKVKSTLAALVVSLASFAGSQSVAASYVFDIVWDGSALSETSSGSGLSSTVLNKGDDFTLTLRAEGTGFWTTLKENSLFPLNPRTNGYTRGDSTYDIMNDGQTVATDTNVNEWRCCAELGTARWEGLANGTVFDTVVMNYTLNTGWSQTLFSNGMSTSSFWRTDLFGNGTNFAYTEAAPSEVPLPAGGVLLLSGMAGFAALRRRKART
jgi:hypothetical protein